MISYRNRSIKNKNTIAVVFDDHRMFAESLASFLERVDSFDSVYTFSDERELMNFLSKKDSQTETVFFVDYYLKDKNCIPLINEAKRLSKLTRTVVVSSVINPNTIKYIASNDPEGFLSKIAGFDEVLACVHALEEGNRYISPVIKQILGDDSQLTSIRFSRREIELLQYFHQGHSILSTAERISLSMHTVVAHRRRMMEKAKCKSMAELLVLCRKNGIVGDAETLF